MTETAERRRWVVMCQAEPPDTPAFTAGARPADADRILGSGTLLGGATWWGRGAGAAEVPHGPHDWPRLALRGELRTYKRAHVDFYRDDVPRFCAGRPVCVSLPRVRLT
ncbi:hypothetical protein MDOR_21640 [Mycolicibacterium doricum]|uniref:Uncharacterized protein n=1 Tax=Mycolicibacterium doricum TaxID=126673 RepID=A0A7I7VUB4_9MYCO|nr:hypothetical protein MDOR_21640 [Mycolicibacterium doricum]